MRITLLSSQNRLKCYENQRMKAEAKEMGIRLQVVLSGDFELLVGCEGGQKLFYKDKPFLLPDVFMPRYTSNYFAHMVTRHFEQSNCLVLNHSGPRQVAKDKLLTLHMLAHNNLPVPKSILAKFPLNLGLVEEQLDYPIVLKKTEGSEGKGIVLCESRNQLEDVMEMLEQSTDSKKLNLILQEFIGAKRGKDIRVFVIGGRAIGAMLRTGRPGDFKANYSGGGTVEAFPLNPEIEWLAVESAKIIGLDIAGVDILFDKEGYRICEVNASPYFEGFEEATGINVAKEIFNYLLVRLGKKGGEENELKASGKKALRSKPH